MKRIEELKKIGIVGVGLIGGSIGLALRSAELKARIVGVGHRKTSIEKAIEIGAIDEGSTYLDILKDVELLIVATPISKMRPLFNQLAKILPASSVVTDAGSVKRKICSWGNIFFRYNIQFVGSHPIAGSEKRGVEFARHDLFKNAYCFITPTNKVRDESIGLVSELWKLLGMKIVISSPEQHDKLLAHISHLPHIIASSLINTAAKLELEYAGTGFMDTTRIASGDTSLWTDIILTNPDNIERAIDRFIKELLKFKDAIQKKDAKKIGILLANAKNIRDKLVEFKYRQAQIE